MSNPARMHLDLLARGTYRGYQWEVAASGFPGYRCGYVCVPAGHPWHGREGHAILASAEGGLDYARADTGPEDGWWLGFHTMHGLTMPDLRLPGCTAETKFIAGMLKKHGAQIKTTNFVIEQCERLIRQADDVACGREGGQDVTISDLSLPQMFGMLGLMREISEETGRNV